MDTPISEHDARAMVRLVAEVAALNTDHTAAKNHLMAGLAKLVGAECWVWMLGELPPDRPPVYMSLNHGGFSEQRFARYLKAISHPDMTELTAPFAAELAATRGHVTRLRQQIDAADRFPQTDAYACWMAADIAPLILSARPINERRLSFIGLYRSAAAPLFDARERKIAHILLTEVSWLHALGWPEDLGAKVPCLSPRCRLVLNLLLESHSRKFIADELGISIHTVSGYVKEIYSAFRVRSHAELMRRFTAAS